MSNQELPGAKDVVSSASPSAEETSEEITTTPKWILSTDTILTVLAWIALVVFVIVTVAPGLGPNKVFLGTDLLMRNAPWAHSAQGVAPLNLGVSDTIDSATPMAQLITSQSQQGSFPLWDPFNSGGTELGALPNAGLFSPLSLPWWILPASSATAGVKIMEIFAVGLGMFLLLRKQWGLANFTVPLATLVFSSSGFMISWTNWPQTRVAAMIPLLFWATDRLATRQKWNDAIWMGLIIATMLLGGFPAVLACSLYAAVAYFFVRAIGAKTSLGALLTALLRSATGVILGLALSAFQILPFAWFSSHYVNFEARAGFKGSHLPFQSLSTTVVPHIFGFPSGLNNKWMIHFIEGFSYIGACTLVLICVACLIRPKSPFPRTVLPFFVSLLLVLGIALYWGGPVLSAIQALPTMSTSPFGRARSLFGFAAAVLAALGAQAIYQPMPLGAQLKALRPATIQKTLASILRILTPLLIATPVLVAVKGSISPDIADFAKFWVGVTAVLMVVPTATMLLAWVRPRRWTATLALVLVIACIAAPATQTARKWWPLSDSDTFYPQTATHSFLEDNLGQDRYATVGGAMMPGTSSFYQLRSLTGHGFTSPAWHSLLSAVDEKYFQTPTWTTLTEANIADSSHSPILDRLGVKYLVMTPGAAVPEAIDGDLSIVHDDDTTIIERNNALDRIRWANSEIVEPDTQSRLKLLASDDLAPDTVILEHDADAHTIPADESNSEAQIAVAETDTDTISATVTSTGPGWVVIADPLRATGWSATIDGNPTKLVDADQVLVALWVPNAGTHEVVLHYQAPMFKAGLIVSGATGSVLVLYGVYSAISVVLTRTKQRRAEVESQ